MEWILLPLADLLRAYVKAIDLAITNKDFLDQAQLLSFPLAFAGMVYATMKWVWRRLSRHDEKLDEKARIAEKNLARAEKKISEIRRRNDELLKFDPEIFIAEMDRVSRDKVMGRLQSFPQEWLSPLRGALARAYSTLSTELLLRASDKEGLDEARLSAWGAIAAEPWAKEHYEILTEIEEAREVFEFENLSEHEIAALKLPRVKQEPQALIAAGRSMLDRGKYKVARLFFGRACELADMNEGSSGPTSLSARYFYAFTMGFLGRYAEAEAELRAVWEIERRPEVLDGSLWHAHDAPPFAHQMRDQGRYAEAEAEFRAVWEIRRRPEILGEEHPDTLATRHNIAQQMGQQGRYAEAEAEFRAVWEIQRRPENLGEEHPDTLTMRPNIAQQMGYQGRYAEAEAEFRAVWEIRRRPENLGEEHPDTLTTRHNIAQQMGQQGRYAEAEAEFRAVWEIRRRPEILGEEHPDTLVTRHNIAYQMGQQGRYAEAEAEFRAVWEIRRRPEILGEEHPDTLTTRANIADEMGQQGRYAEAEAEYRAVWEIQRRPEILGEEHPDTLRTRANIAQQMGNQGRYAEAEAEFRAVWEIRRRPEILGEEHPDHMRTKYWLAKVLDEQGKRDQATQLLDGLMEEMTAYFDKHHLWIRELESYLSERHPESCQKQNAEGGVGTSLEKRLSQSAQE